MIITDEIGINHQTAATAEGVPTGFGYAMGHHDAMNPFPFWFRKGDWDWLSACTIEEETVWMLFDPSLSTIDLFSGFLDRLLVPSPPGHFRPCVRLVLDMFVTEDDDMVLEYYEQVTDFFPIPTMAARPSLVAVDARVAPEAEEGPLCMLREIPLGGIRSRCPSESREDLGEAD